MGKRRKPIIYNEKRLFYSIQEVADHFAVNVSLLRYWEEKFDNINPKKTTGGTRQYTRDDIKQIEMVYHLVKGKGMTLDGAQQILKSKKDDETKRIDALEKLKSIKKELIALQDEFDILHNMQKYSNLETE